jgi:hypothetical protein
MAAYVRALRVLDSTATPENPIPARDAVFKDLHVGEGKALSVFVPDCVQGNCFPIDSRVRWALDHFGLPEDERLLVGLCLRLGRDSRPVARMFFDAGAVEERPR